MSRDTRKIKAAIAKLQEAQALLKGAWCPVNGTQENIEGLDDFISDLSADLERLEEIEMENEPAGQSEYNEHSVWNHPQLGLQ